MKVGTVYWMLSSSCQDVWSLCTYVLPFQWTKVSVERLFSDEVVVHLLSKWTKSVLKDSSDELLKIDLRNKRTEGGSHRHHIPV